MEKFLSLQTSVMGKDRLSAEEEEEKAQKLTGFLLFPHSARTYYDHWQLFLANAMVLLLYYFLRSLKFAHQLDPLVS